MFHRKSLRFVFAMLLSMALLLSILPVSRVQGLRRSQDSPTPTPTPLPILPNEACLTWNLASDFQLAPNQANPGPDACDQADVWHFLESASLDRDPATYTLLPEFAQDIAGIFGLEGWRSVQYPELPVVGLNATGSPQTSATWVWPPDVIYVHPAPMRMVIVGWRSPVDGVVAISGSVSDLDANGGDGIEWYIDKGAANLTSGDYGDGGAQDFENGTGGSSVANVPVSQGEFIYFIVHPRGDFDYDSTELDITINLVQPLPNDDFDSATSVGALPFTDILDTTQATWAEDDPTECHNNGSVWYAFTPSTDMVIEANTVGSDYDTTLSAYTGSRGALSLVPGACNDDYYGLQSRVVFNANAGTTYFFLVGRCCGQGGDGGGQLVFSVQEPTLVADFGFEPYDPSEFDTVQFYDWSWDPADVGLESQEWDFGDGTTASGCCPSHQYTAEGDYTVQLTVTTYDGRTASTSRVVSVRTHDVAITKFSVPKSASVGQTRQIVVGVNSRRYPEQVEVVLYRSVPGGFDWVGSLRQSVPVRPSNRTTNFAFSYTFTEADKRIGKVTFKAEANIIDAWDALPADNMAIAPPTKVR